MPELSTVHYKNETYTFKDAVARESINQKYEKAGGLISGNVKIDGELSQVIRDEDYDAGVKINSTLNNNLGTVITLTGYADNTTYKPVIRNVAEPSNNYDVANKKYVDEHVLSNTKYLVEVDSVTKTVVLKSSSLTYSTVKHNLNSNTQNIYLDVLMPPIRFSAKAIEDRDTNYGPIKFIAPIIGTDNKLYITEFSLASDDSLTYQEYLFEDISNKTNDILSNSSSTLLYPSTSAVYNQFMRKPDVVWEAQDIAGGLLATNTNLSNNVSWQLTGLNLSPYKYIKVYARSSRKNNGYATSVVPAAIIELSLDPRNAEPVWGYYIGSALGQNPNDANRLSLTTVAVSADKTSFVVVRQNTLYGTAATSNTDVYAYIYRIEGYYD